MYRTYPCLLNGTSLLTDFRMLSFSFCCLRLFRTSLGSTLGSRRCDLLLYEICQHLRFHPRPLATGSFNEMEQPHKTLKVAILNPVTRHQPFHPLIPPRSLRPLEAHPPHLPRVQAFVVRC